MTKRVAFLMLLPMLFLPLRPVAATSTATDCVEPFEAEVARLVNVERAKRGLASLEIVDTLSAASEHWEQQMGHHGWFGHIAPSGVTWADNQRNHGYTSNAWRGQVIAGGQNSPAAVVTAWMGSPTHRDLLLNPNYRVIGVGYGRFDGSPYGRYWVADLGGSYDGRAEFC